VLLISGGMGDAGQWAPVAPTLAEEFTVVTYDWRGFSRSPRPDGWTATSVAELADDAAALLRDCDLAPAAVSAHLTVTSNQKAPASADTGVRPCRLPSSTPCMSLSWAR
jgi:alpha-beta hydrolase superfamily lysophospholipase